MAESRVNFEPVLRRITRRKERKPLDVIPMRVGEKERSFDRLSGCFFDQLFSKEAQTAAGIENEKLRPERKLDAGRVTAVAKTLRGRRRNRAAGTEKTHLNFALHRFF